MGSVKADSRLKDPEKIAADIEAKRAEVVDKTGLDGSFGRVFCISIADSEGGEVFTYCGGEVVDEQAILEKTMDKLAEINCGRHAAQQHLGLGNALLQEARSQGSKGTAQAQPS